MSNFVYFISTSYLKDNSAINENVDDKLLKSAIKEAQEIYIRDISPLYYLSVCSVLIMRYFTLYETIIQAQRKYQPNKRG